MNLLVSESRYYSVEGFFDGIFGKSKWYSFPLTFYKVYLFTYPDDRKENDYFSIYKYSTDLSKCVERSFWFTDGELGIRGNKSLKGYVFKLKAKTLKKKITICTYRIDKSLISSLKENGQDDISVKLNKKIKPIKIETPTVEEILEKYGAKYEIPSNDLIKERKSFITQVMAIITEVVKSDKYKEIKPGLVFGSKSNEDYKSNLDGFCAGNTNTLEIGVYDLWDMNKQRKGSEFKNRSEMSNYFWNIMTDFQKEINSKIGSMKCELNMNGDWDDGPIILAIK